MNNKHRNSPAEKSELIAHSLHKKKASKVIMLSRDGWVVTQDGAFGDNRFDCKIVWNNQITYLKELRKQKKLSQQEMSWILGISRPSYIGLEQGKQELTHKAWLITKIINEKF